jgi:hypothetical protein
MILCAKCLKAEISFWRDVPDEECQKCGTITECVDEQLFYAKQAQERNHNNSNYIKNTTDTSNVVETVEQPFIFDGYQAEELREIIEWYENS